MVADGVRVRVRVRVRVQIKVRVRVTVTVREWLPSHRLPNREG